MIRLVSKWENRLHPPTPSDKENYRIRPTSFPNLLRLTKKEKALNNEAMITYKRPITVGQLFFSSLSYCSFLPLCVLTFVTGWSCLVTPSVFYILFVLTLNAYLRYCQR